MYNLIYPDLLNKIHNLVVYSDRGSIISEVSAGVKATMQEEFKELQFQLLTNTKKELQADLSRFDLFHPNLS